MIMTYAEVKEELAKMVNTYLYHARSRRDAARNKYADDPNSYSADLDENLADDYETAAEWLQDVSRTITNEWDNNSTFTIEKSGGWTTEKINIYGDGYLIESVKAPLC